MYRYIKLLVTCLIGATTLAVLIGSASANNLSASNGRVRQTWSSLEFSNAVNSTTVRCPVTLEGSFMSATVRKVSHATIGRISVALLNNNACTSGHATIHQTSLPWNVSYESFIGRLPIIEGGVRLLTTGTKYELEAGIKCTVTFTPENASFGIMLLGATGQVEGLRADETQSFALEGLCGFFARGIWSGTAQVRLLGTTNTISVKLI